MTKYDVANKARELHGLRFRKYGRELKHGLDCVGVPIWVGQQLGLVGEVVIPPYTFPPDPQLFDDLLPQFGDEVETPDIGSVLVLLSDKGKAQHMGIVVPAMYTGNLHCIGAVYSPSRAYIGEYKLDATVRSHIHKVFNYRGLEA